MRGSPAKFAALTRRGLLLVLPFTAMSGAEARPVVRPPRVAISCGCPVIPRAQGEWAEIGVLAAKICNDASALPTAASIEDLQAAMVFAISQASAKPGLARAALLRLTGCTYGQTNFAAALSLVLASLDNRRFRPGTAAISGGFSSGFTAPGVNVGGGSSNYTR